MMLQVVCEGDTETFLPCSEEHGGGTYAIQPSGTVINAFVRVVGKRMICRGQTFPGHCAASAGTAMGQQSGWFRVAGVPVCGGRPFGFSMPCVARDCGGRGVGEDRFVRIYPH